MVEIIPKTPVEKPYWVNIIFYISSVLLFISVLSFFILSQFQNRAVFTLKELEESLIQTRTQERINLEKELIKYQKKIDDFSYLLSNRRQTQNSFTFLEKITHPKVYFSDFNFSSDTETMTLKGEAADFQILGQQFLIFKSEPLVSKVDLSEVSIGREGRIDFTFNLSFSKEIFK